MASKPSINALYARICSDVVKYCPSGCLPDDPTGSFGDLPPDATSRQFSALALAKSICKKWEDESEDSVRLATLKFLEMNARCSEWSLPERDESFSSAYEQELLGEFKRVLHSACYQDLSYMSDQYPGLDWSEPLDWTKISFFADIGPGTAVGAEGCSWLEKFCLSPLTYSRDFLLHLWTSRACSSDLAQGTEWIRDLRFGVEQVQASKFHVVPKTVSIGRAICIEPSLNMFFQKGTQFLLEAVLRTKWGIDLSDQQTINGELARIGSITGRFGTLDLTSASDTISAKMLKWALPRGVFDILSVMRTPKCVIDGVEVDLHLFSSMGNAFTFPLQTMLFLACVEAVYNCRGISLQKRRTVNTVRDGKLTSVKTLGNFAVNGDDIIVVADAYNDVCKLLKLLGFIPNLAKSFNTGYFRESCGQDWYQGHGVRGVYCKTLETQQDFTSLINRLVMWSVAHEIDLTGTLRYLRGFLKGILYVPYYEADDSGVKAPLELSRPQVLRAGHVFRDNCAYQAAHYVYARYEFAPVSYRTGALLKNGGFCKSEAEVAVLIATLKGEVNGRVLHVRPTRSDTGYYDIRRVSTHAWDADYLGLPLSKGYLDRWMRVLMRAGIGRSLCSKE